MAYIRGYPPPGIGIHPKGLIVTLILTYELSLFFLILFSSFVTFWNGSKVMRRKEMIVDTKDRRGSKSIKPSTRKCVGSLPGHHFHSFKKIKAFAGK